MDWKTVFYFPAYLLLFCGATFAILLWNRRRRNKRSPFKTETRVLRLPGESLRERIAEIDEALDWKFFVAAFVPLTAAWVSLQGIRFLSGWGILVGIVVAGLVFTFTFVLAARWISKAFFERANHELGWYGERVVGDALAALERDGWRIFHDFPREEKKKKFNIDHIAVGPSGVFALETKTPRKPKSEDGHVITFDGRFLRTPGGWQDRKWIEQSLENAEWLKKWLLARTGKKLKVEAVLTFPDWMVPEEFRGPPLVLSSSRLVHCLTAEPKILSAKQIDQVARLIEGVCRDVAY